MKLKPEEIVYLSKACYGLIDAPRRWWKALVNDMQKLGWRSCRNEPCLMTWHHKGKLKGLMCFHVDDIMLSGDNRDTDWRKMLDKIKGLYDWGAWESGTFEQCGCRIQQTETGSILVDQEEYARKITLIPLTQHRRRHMQAPLNAEERHLMVAKRGELNWLATQTMIQALSSLSLLDTSMEATGESLRELNHLIRRAHAEAADKLQYPVLVDPVFLTYADAAWANRKDMGSQCGYLVVGTERALLQGRAAPCCPISWHSRRCPRVARSSGSAETQAATQAQEEMEFIRLLWLEIEHGGYDAKCVDSEISKVTGALVIDAKGVYDAIRRSESAALSMQDKRSAVEGLALRESIARTRTELRWCHSEANVADALTKQDTRAHELLRKFLSSRTWRIVWDPDFTSSKKLKAQGAQRKEPHRSASKSTNRVTGNVAE